ncbi:hypothetical protein KI387_017635 [Taxus chinensis]|uniref:C2 domain-containing protein n=1 Tax=Taxus chinensis TaxID=29808 RepID=A0AA38GH22_TAXCH|nr:hypothetical protein KI387_017635 [Taxus chinensis]
MSKCVKVKVVKGNNLVVRDFFSRSSDPYVLLKLGPNLGSTRVVDKNLNPVWDEEFRFPITDFNRCSSLQLQVWDKDTVFGIDCLDPDDYMGEAVIDLKPLVKGDGFPAQGKVVLYASEGNCLFKDSVIVEHAEGKRVQDVCLRLRNVKSGLLYLQLEWTL